MPTLQVDSLAFHFPANMAAEPYDKWQHTTADWAARYGKKAVDVVAIEPATAPATTWLIEAKDFRIITTPPKPSNLGSLPQTVAQKMKDTLLGLADAAANGNVATESSHASLAMGAPRRRVILHLEPHPPTGTHTALFPTNFAASVYQTLKVLVASIDSQPLVLNIANTPLAGMSWTVS